MAFWTQSPSHAKTVTGVDEIRARYDALFARFTDMPTDVEHAPGQLGPIPGEWLHTADSDGSRLLLYFHGGGFVSGSPQSHRPLIARIVEASGLGAFSVKYRLAPDCFFPAPVRDGIDAYRALLSRGLRGASIVLVGDEAGGGLALSVALAIRNAGLEMPGGVAALSPWADLSLSGLSLLGNRKTDTALGWENLFACARHYLRKSNPCDAYASPAWANLKDFPPLMVHAGSQEVLRDDASKLGDRANEAGVSVSVEIYDGMGHLFQADPARPEAKASMTRLVQFIRARSQVMAA